MLLLLLYPKQNKHLLFPTDPEGNICPLMNMSGLQWLVRLGPRRRDASSSSHIAVVLDSSTTLRSPPERLSPGAATFWELFESGWDPEEKWPLGRLTTTWSVIHPGRTAAAARPRWKARGRRRRLRRCVGIIRSAWRRSWPGGRRTAAAWNRRAARWRCPPQQRWTLCTCTGSRAVLPTGTERASPRRPRHRWSPRRRSPRTARPGSPTARFPHSRVSLCQSFYARNVSHSLRHLFLYRKVLYFSCWTINYILKPKYPSCLKVWRSKLIGWIWTRQSVIVLTEMYCSLAVRPWCFLLERKQEVVPLICSKWVRC